MLDPSAFSDTFARDHLPPFDLWPQFEGLDALGYPKRFNAAVELIDRQVEAGFGPRLAIRTPAATWTYEQLLDKANRIAAVLRDDLGLVPGNRVLLRSANNAMKAAAWLGVLKAGGIAVATMPLLRTAELSYMLGKAGVQFALCDVRLAGELDKAAESAPALKTLYFHTDAADGLEARMARKSGAFDNVIPSHDDVALIAFTSGTTGQSKATVHFHRDVLAIADCLPRHILKPVPDDVFLGSAPFAFTFGLGAMLVFPLRFGASAVMLEQPTPDAMLSAVEREGVSRLFTVPTLYRSMTPLAAGYDVSSLKSCISSGEHMPLTVLEGWYRATGVRMMNSIGSTEMLHGFVINQDTQHVPGSVGKPAPGYRAIVVDDDMNPLPPGQVGKLAVRGPTGCRYLSDPERQKKYVQAGWNLTGDAFETDAEGNFWYHARTDDMIVSAGYNISGAEVEGVLLQHAFVAECAVVGLPNEERGQIVAAYVVLREGAENGDAMKRELQDLVKAQIAPYKYPRAIEFVPALPKTITGKISRNALREMR
ncbi:AMP-binding protein [Pseudorhodoplanes sp.]|uniref:AMP-binding protein n=1 Tax=Pseudorhodoplanes sp. TaxID=1934341 RepID=UPI002C8439CE|nr:AMP-binding protein [Pseudorhodoplanes sp.]HWV54145.1 AMP-binding protein [Pseudorhodoplanes sp.]